MRYRSGYLKRSAGIVLLLTASFFALALVQETAPADLLKTAEEMLRVVTRLRGLEPKNAIPMGVKSRDEISKFLNERVRENVEEGELQSEGKMLHRLGLLPADMDYKDFTLELLTEQVGGYYDPDKKTFFIAGWLQAELQKPVMVHELTHALQDQYFDLNKVLHEERKLHNDDRMLARQAIFEGDGMAVMLDFVLEPKKRNFASLPDLVFVMQSQFGAMNSQFPIFKSAPDYLKETLLFPYGYGAAFLQKVWAAKPSWDAVNKIYSDLPVSTEQIIHPEKYIGTRDDPKPVKYDDPATRLGNGWKIGYKNVLGEFTIDLLLKLNLSEEKASRAAAGWGGDQVFLLENESGKNAVFVATTWDMADDADEFYQAMSDWLQKKYPKGKPTQSPNRFSLSQDGEFHMIQRDGQNIQFFLGVPESDASKLK